MIGKTATATIAILCLLGAATSAGDDRDDEYAVYAAVLRQLASSRPAPADGGGYLFVVSGCTAISPRRGEPADGEALKYYRRLTGSFADLDTTAIASFITRNRQPSLLEARQFSGLDVELMPQWKQDLYFRAVEPAPKVGGDAPGDSLAMDGTSNGGWRRFYREHPRSPGLITLSRVGFSLNGSKAFVYLGRESGTWSGDGHAYLLERSPSGWVVARSVQTWIE
jgi:hypothetical protein